MRPDDVIATRHSLLNRLKNLDDQQSWQDFYNTYWRLIYGAAIQAGLSDAEAQDVVQETVITVARTIKDFKVGAQFGSFKAWLLHTTRWRIADQLRKRPPDRGRSLEPPPKEETPRTPTEERVPDPASLNLEAVWDQQWRQNLVDLALEKVKARTDPAVFQMFDLHVCHQWPAHKVAHKLGVTLGQVYFAKYKIAASIRKEIKRLEKEMR
jgi:RNA polymerase sigma-70 factor (ECF subfamily)